MVKRVLAYLAGATPFGRRNSFLFCFVLKLHQSSRCGRRAGNVVWTQVTEFSKMCLIPGAAIMEKLIFVMV
jgi:hypothetical protein